MTDLDFATAVIELVASAVYLIAAILERLPVQKDKKPPK